MFDGNINFIKKFASSNYTLQGIFIVFFMLIFNLDWIDLKKETIKSKLDILGYILGDTGKPKNIPKILKSIYECKNKDEGWSNFRDIKERHELHPIIRILEENHLIIQRRFAQFKLKLKNGLTEQVLNDYQL